MMTDEKLKAAREAKPPWMRQQNMASGVQQEYMKDLIEQRVVPESWLRRIKEIIDNGQLTKSKASDIITSLKTLQWKPKAAVESEGPNTIAFKDIPAGYYALPVPDAEEGENDILFYRVKKARNNENRGWVHIIHGPDSTELNFQAGLAILRKIKNFGIAEAAVLYGRKIGRCSQCNRRLSNRISRELAIGPVCGGRVYRGDWQGRVNNARQAILDRGEDPDENIEEV